MTEERPRTKSGRELEPERMTRASPKQRAAARWFLNTLGKLFGDDRRTLKK